LITFVNQVNFIIYEVQRMRKSKLENTIFFTTFMYEGFRMATQNYGTN